MVEELRCDRGVDEDAVQKPQELQVHPNSHLQKQSQGKSSINPDHEQIVHLNEKIR